MQRRKMLIYIVFVLGIMSSSLTARDIHVAKNGSDANSGSQALPLLTISKAAELAEAGDVITVHAGSYREWVKPVNSGSSEGQRITFQAAAGEEVFIKGSEQMSSWTDRGNGVWKLEIPNAFFGKYNPYEKRVSEKYMTYGEWHHRGDVFLNGEGMNEQQTIKEVELWKNRWYCEVVNGVTSIWANFQQSDPNKELVEINVRESIFMPEVSGVNYITVSGFKFMHAATNWAPPSVELQMGAVGPHMGKKWIIEDCEITHARTVGIILGLAPGADYSDIDSFGDHIIRNNIIRKCGQGGIAGKRGASRSLITGNLIEDTNYREEFGGHETAAIKLHRSVDVIISNNLIRGVYARGDQAAFGMWIDFTNQGMRITRNIVYNTKTEAVFLEMNHGPILLDNNIFLGLTSRGFSSNSEATVLAHNLFVNCKFSYSADTNRQSQYFTPHTSIELEKKPVILQEEKWYNNLFIGAGPDNVPAGEGYESDYNVFLEGAKKTSFGDENSLEDPFISNYRKEESQEGVKLTFYVNKETLRIVGPRVDGDLVGIFEISGQTIEDRNGEAISVDSDFNGLEFSRNVAGPLANLKKGINEVSWSFNASE